MIPGHRGTHQERPDYVALRKLFADVRAEIGPTEAGELGRSLRCFTAW